MRQHFELHRRAYDVLVRRIFERSPQSILVARIVPSLRGPPRDDERPGIRLEIDEQAELARGNSLAVDDERQFGLESCRDVRTRAPHRRSSIEILAVICVLAP